MTYSKIPLTQGQVALVDAEDIVWLTQYGWHFAKRNDGKGGYVKCKINGRQEYMHTVVMRRYGRLLEGCEIDHRNGNGIDNRKRNLRVCQHHQNLANQRRRSDNTSGVKGVHFFQCTRRWQAYITVRGKRKHLGYFSTRTEAKKVREQAAQNEFGEFACT